MDKICENLEKLCLTAAPSNEEANLHSLLIDLFSCYTDEYYIDNIGNIVFTKKSSDKNAKTILFDAHADEIGFIVSEVKDNGFVKVKKHCGPDERTMPSAEFIILGKKPIYAVCATTPPHLAKKEDKDKPVEAENMLLDTGYTDVKQFVSVGDSVVYKADFYKLKNDFVLSKAFDNRACIAVMLELCESIKNSPAKNNLVFCISVGEEIGAGATAAVINKIKPDVTVVLDVTFSIAPGILPTQAGHMGQGPMIGIAPILDRQLFRRLKKIAEENNISYQVEVMAGTTGTNSWCSHIANCGAKTALVSIPIKNMHSPSEIVKKSDITLTCKLLKELANTQIGGAC